jgi:IclR family transcriptional regulator, acetate operon repressor
MPGGRPILLLSKSRRLVDVLLEHGPMTPAEIGEAIGVPRPTAYRLVSGLNAIELTQTRPDGTVDLNLRWLHLADAAYDSMTEWAGAHAVLTALSAQTEQTAYLCVPRAREAVCIDWSQGRGIGALMLRPGLSLPLHAGAAGRLMLAYLPDAADYLAAAEHNAFTPKSLTDAAALKADIEQTLDRGYAVSSEDVTMGIGALGVPVLGARGELRGTVSLGGLIGEIREREHDLVAAIRAAARQLEDLLRRVG